MTADTPVLVKEYRGSRLLLGVYIISYLIYLTFFMGMTIVSIVEQVIFTVCMAGVFLAIGLYQVWWFLREPISILIYSNNMVLFRLPWRTIRIPAISIRRIVGRPGLYGYYFILEMDSMSIRLPVQKSYVVRPGHHSLSDDLKYLITELKALNPDLKIINNDLLYPL